MPTIIVADAHVNETFGNHVEFFEMLGAIESCGHDVIFLGDIFDLWVALPRYERKIHRRFLDWCKTQKQQRIVGFVEGNHEYFLADERGEFFTWCTAEPCRQDAFGVVFCHGDQINRLDRNYLFFRKLAKNAVAKQILRFLPLGPELVEHLKSRMKNTNQQFKNHFPGPEIDAFAEDRFENGGRTIFVGHFHRTYSYRSAEGRDLYTVRGWFGTGTVTLFDGARNTLRQQNWRDLFDSKG